MKNIIRTCRRTVLSAPDTVCTERARLATEGYTMFADEPVPLCRAKTLNHILSSMTLDLDTNPVFAGNMSTGPRKWMLLPEYGFHIPAQAVTENPSLAGFLDGNTIPDDIRNFWKNRSFGTHAGHGHLIPDNKRLVEQGLEGIIKEAEENMEHNGSRSDEYREACIISCKAVIQWARRYAEHARAAVTGTDDPQRASCLERISEACMRVPAESAQSLFEALQSIVLVQFAIHIEGHGYSVSPGRLDQILAPFYHDGDTVSELIEAFLLKICANSLWGSHSKTQPVTIGGMDKNGQDLSNGLTRLFLEACESMRVPEPTLFLRWHENMDDRIKEKAVSMLSSGLSFPLLIGDRQTVAGLVRCGISPEHAADYAVIGCNEVGIRGKLIWKSATLPEARIFREYLLSKEADNASSAEEMLENLGQRAEHHLLEQIPALLERWKRIEEAVPTPFTSALMNGCAARGRDLAGELHYPHINIRSSGFSNLVNGISAVHELVFRQQTKTVKDFRNGAEHNFNGCGTLREDIRRAPKWGNDDDRADDWALAWISKRDTVIARVREAGEYPPLLMEMVVRSLHHVEGSRLEATPDGRTSGTPLADSIGAVLGTASAGPTALLNSVCKMDSAQYWPGGYNLNLALPLTAWTTDVLRAKLTALIDVFFSGGGQELQINCIDPDMLERARQDPEQYRDLMVRIAGFNAFFVKLSPEEQEELINRAAESSRVYKGNI